MNHSSDIVTQLVELTCNATNAFTTALYSLDHDRNTLSIRAHISLSSNFDAEAAFQYGKGAIGLVAKNKEPLLLESCEEEIARIKIYKKKELLKSFLAIPIIYDEVEGVLIVDSKEIYSFSTKMQKIIAGFAGQLAWHLHRERQGLIGPKEEIFPYQEMLNFNRLLGEQANSAGISGQLLNIPLSIFACDAIAVISFDKEGEPGRVVRHRGWGANLTDLPVLPGKGIIGSCAKNKASIWIENTEKRKTVLFSENDGMEEFKSLLAVPLLSNNQLLGVIACVSRKSSGLTQNHLGRLSMIASCAASFLSAARIKQQWDYAKNLDPITEVPNHRFLADYRRAIETEIFNHRKPVFALMIQIKNLPALYETYGVEMGDKLLRQIAAILSNSLPPPKHTFKYSDAAFLVLLMQVSRDEASHLESRLRLVFDENPVYVDGKSVFIATEIGLSSYPEDGKNLGEIIGAAWARTSQHVKVTT